MVDFIILTKRGDGRSIILRAENLVNVSDEGTFRIVRFKEGDCVNLLHVRDDIKDIMEQIQQIRPVVGLSHA